MWIMPSRKRPNNVRRFFEKYRETKGSTPGVIVIDDTDPQIEDYKSLDYPEGWSLEIYPECPMVSRLNQSFSRHIGLDWYGSLDDDSVPETDYWDKKLVEAAGKDKIAHCHNGISNEKLVCQYAIGGELARKIGWLLLPGTKRTFGDNAITDVGRKLNAIVYLPDVKLTLITFMSEADWQRCGFLTLPASQSDATLHNV